MLYNELDFILFYFIGIAQKAIYLKRILSATSLISSLHNSNNKKNHIKFALQKTFNSQTI